MSERNDENKSFHAFHYIIPSLLVLIGLIFTTSADIFTKYDSRLTGDFQYVFFVFFIGFVLVYIDLGKYNRYVIGVKLLGKTLFASCFSFILVSYFLLKGVFSEDMNLKLLYFSFSILLIIIISSEELAIIYSFYEDLATIHYYCGKDSINLLIKMRSSISLVQAILIASSIISFIGAIGVYIQYIRK
jgi:hypothetical protein